MKFALAFLICLSTNLNAESPIRFRAGVSDPNTGKGVSFTPQLEGYQTGQQDQIQGKCETKTQDMIPVIVPCRDFELILMRGESKEIARGSLDPAGRFQFGNLPYGTYSLVVKIKKLRQETRLDGLKPGFSYTISSADTTPGK